VTTEERTPAEKKTLPSVRVPTPTQAKQWEELAPGTFNRFMVEIEQEEKHRRCMESADFCSRIFGQVCAFGTVVVFAFLARYFVDHGAATQGASIIITGAVSIVTVFLTNRLARRR
jgi:uncharacterized membrane protein